MINILIPMAGLGSRFSKAGYKKPKPFIDVEGKAMIERVINNLSYSNARFILVAQEDHIVQEVILVNELKKKHDIEVVTISKLTEGTACTVLSARKFINNDMPLVIANSDQLVDIKFSDFIDECFSRNLDGSILTFQDKTKNPKWSYAKVNNEYLVTEVKEKEAISDIATVGIYLFKKGSDFVNAAIDMIVENERVNNEFYTCPVYNYLIREQKKIGVYNIHYNQMHGLGTPEDLQIYLERD